MAKKLSRKKRKAVIKKFQSYGKVCNCHHLLWIAREWDAANCYARKLRNSSYFKVMIPRDTIHKEIHHEMARIPVPGRAYCAKAYEEMVLGLKEERLHENDSVLTRLDFLMNIFTLEACPKTYLALAQEYDIFRKYYASLHQES